MPAADPLRETDRTAAAELPGEADRAPAGHPAERAAEKMTGTETGTAADRAEDDL